MQHSQQDSVEKPVTVEKLLHLKRLEKPIPAFWDRFDRELKQRQLQTLMRPSLWGRVRKIFPTPEFSPVGAISAATIVFVAIGFVAFSFLPASNSILEVANVEPQTSLQFDSVAAPREVAANAAPGMVGIEEEAVYLAEAGSRDPGASDSRFVEVVLRPGSPASGQDSFKTVAETETFTGASDDSAYYVVNAFTVIPQGLSGEKSSTLGF